MVTDRSGFVRGKPRVSVTWSTANTHDRMKSLDSNRYREYELGSSWEYLNIYLSRLWKQ